MENRNLEYFSGRLEKDNYTKDEVAGLLHSEAEFTTRTATKNMVSKEDYDSTVAKLNETQEALKPYMQKEFNDTIGVEFKKLNGNVERQEDLIKLAGITSEDTQEIMSDKIVKTKESGKYDFLFNKVDSGIKPNQIETAKKPTKVESSMQYGAGFFTKLFKK